MHYVYEYNNRKPLRNSGTFRTIDNSTFSYSNTFSSIAVPPTRSNLDNYFPNS